MLWSILHSWWWLQNMRPSVDELPASLLPLVQSCWAEDPSLRPEFSEITKTLTMMLCSTGTALGSITDIEEELDSNIEDHKTPKYVENISKHNNHGPIKPNGCIESESQFQCKAKTLRADSAKRRPKKNNRKLKYLCLLRCFGIWFGYTNAPACIKHGESVTMCCLM